MIPTHSVSHSRAQVFLWATANPSALSPIHPLHKGQGPKAKHADELHDMTSARADLCTGLARVAHWCRLQQCHVYGGDGMPPILEMAILHMPRRMRSLTLRSDGCGMNI